MYRDDDNGQFSRGPPRDWDAEADRFRAQSGRFKDQSNYGPDDKWGSGASKGRGMMRVMDTPPDTMGGMGEPMLSDTDNDRSMGIPETEIDFGGL
jgi:hypothetical protein